MQFSLALDGDGGLGLGLGLNARWTVDTRTDRGLLIRISNNYECLSASVTV